MATLTQESLRGSIWGLAIGDALGATVEFKSRQAISQEWGQLREIQGGGWLNLPAGHWTDDTAMTLATAQGIMEAPDDPLEAVGARYLAWADESPPDIGNTVRLALHCYRQTSDWLEAGQLAYRALGDRSAGNGGLIRVAPVGLAYWRRSAQRDHWARQLTAMTHANPLCQFLSLVYCALLASCVGREAQPREAYRMALDHGQGLMGEAIPNSLLDQLEAMVDWNYADLRATGYALDTFIAACWCFLHQDSAEEAIVAAVNLGDDADTVGAVTGALVGARDGWSALPERWRRVIDRPDRLDEVSQGLTEMAQQK